MAEKMTATERAAWFDAMRGTCKQLQKLGPTLTADERKTLEDAIREIQVVLADDTKAGR